MAIDTINEISVVVPVYKAQDTLHELYARLCDTLVTITEDFEIILVDDCGGDRSWEIIQELSARDSRVKGVQFSRNFGQHFGITAGLDISNGRWVVVMDCDLQDRPEEILTLYNKAQEGYDIVLARRAHRKDTIFKRFTSWMFYKVFSYLADIDYDTGVGNFRIVSRKVADNFKLMRERLRLYSGLVDWMGFNAVTVDVVHDKRHGDGKSTYTFAKLWSLAWDTIIAHSDKPLRMSIRFGFLMSAFALTYGSYIFIRALYVDIPVEGWSSLIVSLYFIGGVIIANLGIIGVYVGKSFDEAKGRPLYIIDKVTSNIKDKPIQRSVR